jgi:ribokinase
MPHSSVIVVGSINTDLVIRGPKLPAPGETVLGGEFYEAAGGKGANQAVAAARASLTPVTFLGAVGDDAFGREALARFQRENLVCDYLKTIAGVSSGVALILVDGSGQNLISVASGANACVVPADIDALPDAVFVAARVFLTCLETPLATVVRGLRRAKEAGMLTILNPAPATREILAADVLSQVDVLTPNENEAALLTGGALGTAERASGASAEAAARKLQELGCRSAIVTLAADGCLVAGREITRIAGRVVEAVDATAAGDCFNGALAVALAEGRSLGDAAAWANVAASISVTRRGAQPSLPTRAEIDNG